MNMRTYIQRKAIRTFWNMHKELCEELDKGIVPDPLAVDFFDQYSLLLELGLRGALGKETQATEDLYRRAYAMEQADV
jgi:hypothetical protein